MNNLSNHYIDLHVTAYFHLGSLACRWHYSRDFYPKHLQFEGIEHSIFNIKLHSVYLSDSLGAQVDLYSSYLS